jgi:lauroyl/myristoyl acyltransferase
MNMPRASAAPGRIEPGMFQGPTRLRPLMPVLRRIPAPPARWMLAGLAIADGLCRRQRFRLASTWAAAQGRRGAARWRLALAILANHGRFVADEAMLGVRELNELRLGTEIRGAEHLRAADPGAILLGFHLGPPRTPYILQAFGYPVRSAGRLEDARHEGQWAGAVEAETAIRLPAGAALERAHGLHRIRNLLRHGALVFLTADGPFGREAFRIDLPGGPLVVRIGWLALRRLTRAPTLPVLTYRDNNQRVIVVHPPLPTPDPDPARDAAACHAVLTPLLETYVRRFPAQCRYLAFPAWP